MFASANCKRWLSLAAMTILIGLLVFTRSAAAQDQPADQPQQEKKDAENPQAQPQPGNQPGATQAPAAPARTQPRRGVQKGRPTRPGATPATPGQPSGDAVQPQTTPDQSGGVPDPEVQRKIDELLRARGNTGEADPELQRQLDDLLKSQGAAPPTEVQQPANAQQTPPEGAPARSDPRELARQRAEERRKRMQQQQTGDPNAQPGQDPNQPPPLPPPQSSFQPQQAEEPSGPTTIINIPPAEDPVPPEERTYGFSIRNGTYEQLIAGFARQTGMGVIGDAPQGGTVDFVTTEKLSFDEALGRVRMLLFNYKPHEPYWLLRNQNNLQVIRVTDMYRIIPLERVYHSLEAYKAANLSPDEICLVFFAPSQGTVNDLMMARDFLGDYVRLTPVDQNRIAIFALVKDIERFLDFIPIIAGKGEDALVLERIEVKNITPTDALSKLSQLMPLDGSSPMRQPIPRPQRPGREDPVMQGIPEPPINVIPDDTQGVLIVRAMPPKIAEIKKLLAFLDVDPALAGLGPVVIPLQHGRPDEIISIVQQMLTATPAPAAASMPSPDTSGTGGRPRRTGVRRRGAAAAAGTSAASTESITLLAHPTNTAIIVLASTDAEVEDVRKLISLVDVPTVLEWVQIPVQNADAESVKETLQTILGDASAKPEAAAVQLFADPSGTSLWFSGSERDLKRVQDLMAKIDVSGDPVKFHIVRIEFQEPSFVANMLREYEGSGAASISAAPAVPAQPGEIAGRRRIGGRAGGRKSAGAAAASKFTPDDANRLLYVLCTAKEWDAYLPVIKQIDVPPQEGAPFLRLAVEHITAEKAVEKLSTMIGGTSGDFAAEVRLIPAGNQILVVGAGERELERIKAFLAEADKPAQVEQRTFEIKFADPSEIKSLIETLLTGEAAVPSATRRIRARPDPAQPSPAPGGGASVSESVITEEMTIHQMGNRLIVRATPTRMAEIAALIEEFDVRAGTTAIRVFDNFPPGVDIESIADTITSVISGGGMPGRSIRPREGGGAPSGGPKLIPQPAAGRLIVIAAPSEFPEIEQLLEVLRFQSPKASVVVEFIEVKHADPADVVDIIEPVLEMKIRGLVSAGELVDPAASAAGDAAATGPAAIRRLSQRRDSGGSDRYHIAPDSRNRRIVVAAPKVIVDEVRQLVAQFDVAGEAGEVVFRTIELTNATPTDMIRAIKEMFGKPAPQRVQAIKRPAAGAAAPAGPVETATGESLTIVEAPGGNSIILHGVKADVDQAETWIKQLDALSHLGRVVKVYKVKGEADVGRVFDLIVNVVDSTPKSAPTPAPRAARPAGKVAEEEPEEDSFTTSKTYTGADMYIQADLIGGTLLVAATSGKVAQIDALLRSFEQDKEVLEAISRPTTSIPKFTYELKAADPDDAKSKLVDALEEMWEPADELPQVEAGSFADILIVRYPHEDRFDEIRALIRKYADKPDEEKIKQVSRVYLPPEGMPPEHVAKIIAASLRAPEPRDATPKHIETYGIEEVAPPKPNGGHPCVLPRSLAVLHGTSAAIGQQSQRQERQPKEEKPDDEAPPAEPPDEDQGDLQDELIREAIPPTIREEKTQVPKKLEREEEPKEDSLDDIIAGEKVEISFDRSTGEIRFTGPKILEEQIKEILDELKKEESVVPAPPDIRIFRVRYIDVFSAQDIIEEMFNATRAQRQEAAAFQQQQLRMQQQAAQLQRQQQMQAQRRGQRGEGDDEQSRAQQQQQQQQMLQQMQTPQLPATTVRVYPNPRDRTLILRADTSQYPQIYKLLATIDQPKPFDSFMRVYPLKKLNAIEVEEMLRQMLNLDGAGAERRGRARAPGAGMQGMDGPGPVGPTSGPGSALPETILQGVVGGTNQLGVDPEDIKLFASEASNSIMVMAPPVALDYIGQIIDKLESGDIPQRLTKYYQLLHADAENVVEYLTAHFAGTDAPKPKRAGGPEGESSISSSGGGTPNAPSFIAYSRLNLITVQATEPQLAEIDAIVAKLDVPTGEEWRDVRVIHADAATVADTLSQMYGGKAGGAPGKTGTGGGPKFIGDSGSSIVLFSAPQNLHQQILDAIAKIDEQSKGPTTIRVITLQNVAPSGVAEAINKAYEPARTGGKGPSAPKFTVTAHDASKQLFVKASDDLFKEISSLVQSLDKPGDLPEFRIYKLQHANAKAVHTMLTKLLTEYMQRLGPQGKGALAAEPFSVQPDEASNSLIVLGGPIVFGFVEENLRGIDTPDTATGPMISETIPLVNVDATEVAATLTRLWTTRGLPPELVPQIEANRSINAIVVRGTKDQIADMKTSVIEPLEMQGNEPGKQTPIRTFVLKFADPTSVADAIGKLFRPSGQNPRDQVQVTPDYGSNSVIVSAAPQNIKRIEELLAQIDTEQSSGQGVHVLEIKHADPQSIAQMLNEIYIRGAQQPGRPPTGVGITIAAVQGSKAVVVRAKPDDLERIRGTIAELDSPDAATGGEVRVVTLLYADAGEVNQAMQEYLRKTGGRGGELMGDVRLSPLAQANGLMVAGAKEEVERLVGIIQAMDVAGETDTVPQLIRLKYANAGLLTGMLQEIFAGQNASTRRGAKPPVITSDPTGEFLIVRASAGDMASIEKTVTALDTEDQADKTPFKILQVKAGINVEDLAEKVETSINETAKARAGTVKEADIPSIIATADPRSNSITLAGSPSLFADAESMIKTLEGMGPAGAPTTRVIRIGQTSPEEIQRLIDQLTKGAGERGRSRSGGSRPSSPRPTRGQP